MNGAWPMISFVKEEMASTGAKARCPHCDLLLSRKSYEAHKRLYYDGDTSQWIKKSRLASNEQDLFSKTEEAIEQLDFDANFSTMDHLSEDYHDEQPSHVDFMLDEMQMSLPNHGRR